MTLSESLETPWHYDKGICCISLRTAMFMTTNDLVIPFLGVRVNSLSEHVGALVATERTFPDRFITFCGCDWLGY